MNKNLKNYIIKSDIPDDLKEYLSKSKNTYNLLSMKIIDDIELIYLEFNTLYIFDLSEFNSIIIESLHKKDKYPYFYNYVKKMLKIYLNVDSEKKSRSESELDTFIGMVKYDFSNDIESYIRKFLSAIKDYENDGNKKSLLLAHRLVGIIFILFKLYPENKYSYLFPHIIKKIEKFNTDD